MESENKISLLNAARRVLKAEEELQLANAAWEEACRLVVGNLPSPVKSDTKESPPAKSVRARIEDFLKNNPGAHKGREISEKLGTRLTTTRFELYELQKAKKVEKPDVDKWRWKPSSNAESLAPQPIDGSAAPNP